MSLEAILTVVTVVLAVIALIPRERGHDLRVRIGGAAAIPIVVAACLMLYWALLEPLHSLPVIRRLPRRIGWLDGWNPASSSLAVFLGAIAYSWRVYVRQLPVGRLPRLSSAISDALARRRFLECAHLLEAHLETIRNGVEAEYWRLRVRRRFLPTFGELHLRALSEREAESGDAPDVPEPNTPPPAVTIPKPKERSATAQRLASWADEPADAATAILRSISLAPEVVRHIASANPYLGHAVTMLPSTWIAREFAETFAEALVFDPESVLYRELRRASNVDRHNVPIVDRIEQPLLSGLCDDVLRPEGPNLLYSYLHAGIDAVRSHRTHSIQRVLNQPIGDFFERGRWSAPPFSTIYLLEVTAPRNAVSSEAQSINLYLLKNLTDTLLVQLSPTDDVDRLREWPTPIHYLIYECVSLLVDIVAIWRDRPEDLPQNKLAQVGERGMPWILPAHAIDVLGSVMSSVLKTQKLESRFKGYLLEVWWRAYWQKYQQPWAQTDTVLARLVSGGPYGGGEIAHRDGLEGALGHVDLLRRMREGGDRIREAFGLALEFNQPRE